MESTLAPNRAFSQLATDEQIERTARALEANGLHTLIANNSEEAKKLVFELLPDGAEVHAAQSQTLETLGIIAEIDKSGRFDAVRPRMFALDRQTQANEIRTLMTRPAFIVGSVQAVTEAGQVLMASFGGGQLAAYASGAGKVIWVVGTQKIVKDTDEGLRRIQEYCYPLEDARLRARAGIGSGVNKLLIINREIRPGRITMILVKEELGF